MTTQQPDYPRSQSSPGTKRPGRKARFDSLVDKLKRIAIDAGPGQKLPEVHELRDAMGVSVTTLTSALDELEACRMIVRKRGVGIFSSADVGKRVIAIVCDPRHFHSASLSPFWDMLVQSALARAESHSEILDMHFAAIADNQCELPPPLIEDIEAERIVGVLCVGSFDKAIRWMQSRRLPVVVYAGAGPYRVGADEAQLLTLAAQRLASLGCKHICVLSPPKVLSSNEEQVALNALQFERFRQILERCGIELDPGNHWQAVSEIVANGLRQPINSQEFGYTLGCNLFSMPLAQLPGGIISLEDMLTLGLLGAAREKGVAIGKDVHVATHANAGSPVLLGWQDVISSISVDPSRIVDLMFTQLERLIAGDATVESVVVAEYS